MNCYGRGACKGRRQTGILAPKRLPGLTEWHWHPLQTFPQGQSSITDIQKHLFILIKSWELWIIFHKFACSVLNLKGKSLLRKIFYNIQTQDLLRLCKTARFALFLLWLVYYKVLGLALLPLTILESYRQAGLSAGREKVLRSVASLFPLGSCYLTHQ